MKYDCKNYFFKFKTTISFKCYLEKPSKTASQKVEIFLKNEKPPDNKYSVTFVTKVGSMRIVTSDNPYLVIKIKCF